MPFPSRRNDDADVIRARLRALLDDGPAPQGWLPDDGDDPTLVTVLREPPAPPDVPVTVPVGSPAAGPPGLGRHRSPSPTARVAPGRRGAWSMWAVAVLVTLAVAGWSWLDRPAVEAVPSSTTSELAPVTSAPPGPSAGPNDPPATVVVSVVGSVAGPGLVTLPSGARVADAIAAAGGLLPGADPASVNGAAVVTDGQQIAVGVPGSPGPPAGAGVPGAAGPLDLNTATVADLDALPGIGPVLAQRIVDHRTAAGRFTSVQELDDVEGIGPAIAARLADLVVV